MSRLVPALVLCTLTAFADDMSATRTPRAQEPSPQALADARSACDTDLQTLCSGVQSGGGRILACLKQHKDEVSPSCKQAVLKVFQGPNAAPGATGPTSAPGPTSSAGPTSSLGPTGLTSPTEPASSTRPSNSTRPTGSTAGTSTAGATSSSAAASSTVATNKAAPGAGDHYFLMKQVQITFRQAGQDILGQDHDGKPEPTYDLMIPTTWDFNGWVNQNAADGGCWADWFAIVGDAKSPDGSIELQFLPQFTWQYVDDPAWQRHLQEENRGRAGVGLKPCPVRAPIHAADFLRQDMLGKFRKGKTIVSIEPFPELDQIARRRLGLPPDTAAVNGTGIRTEAARARVAYDNDKGEPTEEWWTAVIVVRTLPSGGRGASYDWHAIMVMDFRAPKGKLDANDKLFKLIASTFHPEPKWQAYSNAVVAELYRRSAVEEAKRSAIVAQFQQHVVDTLNGVVANQQAGSLNSAFGAGQLIRGVQTFRDPGSGATFELSNQYDHAWLNGSNEYVMSDDPNFNPNGHVTGSWTQLQPVRPQP